MNIDNPNLLNQDCSRPLFRWFANKIDAKHQLRQNANMTFNLDQAVHAAKARLERLIHESTREHQREIALLAKMMRLRAKVTQLKLNRA